MIELTIQAGALTKNGTGNLSVRRTMPNQPNHTGQGGDGKDFILVLIRKFQTNWFEFLLLGETETIIRLVIKFWFGDGA